MKTWKAAACYCSCSEFCKSLGQLIFPPHIFLGAAAVQTSLEIKLQFQNKHCSLMRVCSCCFLPQSLGGNCSAANCTDKYSIKLIAKSGQGQMYLNFNRQRVQREKHRSHLGAQDQSHVNISALQSRWWLIQQGMFFLNEHNLDWCGYLFSCVRIHLRV